MQVNSKRWGKVFHGTGQSLLADSLCVYVYMFRLICAFSHSLGGANLLSVPLQETHPRSAACLAIQPVAIDVQRAVNVLISECADR